MVALLRSGLALLALQVLRASATTDTPAEDATTTDASPDAEASISVDIGTAFPDLDQTFGIKLVNGKTTNVHVILKNNEEVPLRLAALGGQVVAPSLVKAGEPSWTGAVANLSMASFERVSDNIIAANASHTFQYSFSFDLQPRDVLLDMMAIVTTPSGEIYRIRAESIEAAIVDPPINIFDPQVIFLYLFLTGGFGATLFFVYKTWIEALFPQFQSKRSGGRKARKAPVPTEAAADAALSGNESTGAGTGAEDFDASWIPAHHLNRPAAKRVRSSASKKKASE